MFSKGKLHPLLSGEITDMLEDRDGSILDDHTIQWGAPSFGQYRYT